MPDAIAMKQFEGCALRLLNQQSHTSASVRETQLLTEEQKAEMYYLPWSQFSDSIDTMSATWEATRDEAVRVKEWLEHGAAAAVCISHSVSGQLASPITIPHC